MAHPNEVMMRNYVDAWARGDVDAAESIYADDVILHQMGRNQFSGVYNGKAAVQDYVKKLWDFTVNVGGRSTVVEAIDVLANDNHAVTIIRPLFERPGKKPVEVTRITLFRIADGMVHEIWVHDSDQYAIDEFFS